MAPERPHSVFVARGACVWAAGVGIWGKARDNSCVTYSTAYVRRQGCCKPQVGNGVQSVWPLVACDAGYGQRCQEGQSIAMLMLRMHVRSSS